MPCIYFINSLLSTPVNKDCFSDSVIAFYRSLKTDFRLPRGFSVMNPYASHETLALTELFYRKYFNDKGRRYFIFGINPGRHGGGITGIPFTDPFNLRTICDIENELPAKKELSSTFIYRMIGEYGGVAEFYQRFFLTAVCPLGFTYENKNANYYDDKTLMKTVEPFIKTTIQQQYDMGCFETCFCLGQGKNLEALIKVNSELNLFKQIIPLAHPRWIMQYQLKKADQYIKDYIDAFKSV